MTDLKQYDYNPSQVEDAPEYKDITNDIHDMIVESWEVKDTKKGAKMLVVVSKHIGGDFDGRKHWSNMLLTLNPDGTGDQGLMYGQRAVKKLFESVTGNADNTDPDALLNIPYICKTVQKDEKDNRGYTQYNLYPQKQGAQETKTPAGTPSWGGGSQASNGGLVG